jgi:hypothetical protein
MLLQSISKSISVVIWTLSAVCVLVKKTRMAFTITIHHHWKSSSCSPFSNGHAGGIAYSDSPKKTYCWLYTYSIISSTISPLSSHFLTKSLLESHRFPSLWLNAIHRTHPCMGTILYGLVSICIYIIHIHIPTFELQKSWHQVDH